MTNENYGSCTFLNMCGDITIVWDESNKEKILEVIRKKMAEGFTFFTTKSFLFKKLTRRVKVTEKNIENLDEIIITDEQFEKMVADMNDPDVASLVSSNAAGVVKRKGGSELTALQRAKRAEDVVGKDSLAIRPIRGG
jgi:hypothetical protein